MTLPDEYIKCSSDSNKFYKNQFLLAHPARPFCGAVLVVLSLANNSMANSLSKVIGMLGRNLVKPPGRLG